MKPGQSQLESARAARQEELDLIRARLGALHPRESVVFGEGNPLASLVLVGEAPGAEEAAAGRPFVGAAGRLLTRLLSQVSLSREDLWITNLVKERPTRTEGGRVLNRPPTSLEVKTDLPILISELRAIQPRAVVSLGSQPANNLIHRDFRMLEEHGRWFAHPLGFQVMATFHPAYVFRHRGPARDRLEEALRRDLASAKEVAEATGGPA